MPGHIDEVTYVEKGTFPACYYGRHEHVGELLIEAQSVFISIDLAGHPLLDRATALAAEWKTSRQASNRIAPPLSIMNLPLPWLNSS